MASAVIHIAVAKEINKDLKMKEKELFLGAIAPDISKQLGESKIKSHFLLNDKSDLPILDNFLDKYQDNLNNPFIMGYYIHLFTDYLWFKYFISEITNDNDYIKLLNENKITCSKEEISKLIYNDYTNLNILLIEEYNLDLSLFYEELEIPNIKFDEIPLNKLQVIVDQMGIIIANSKKEYTYSFNIDNIKQFIEFCKKIIINDIKTRLN
jgi:hypothetical protein